MQSKSFEYTRARLIELEGQAREEIARLGGNEELERLLDYLGAAYKEPVKVEGEGAKEGQDV